MYEPFDHVRKSVRDDRQQREAEAKARAVVLYKNVNCVKRAFMKALKQQSRTALNETAWETLGIFMQQSVTAMKKGDRTFWLSNSKLGEKIGKSSRTASASRGKLERYGMIIVSARPRGGRNSMTGRGYAKEYHVIDFAALADGLRSLGYRLPKRAERALDDLAQWQRNKLETVRHRAGGRDMCP